MAACDGQEAITVLIEAGQKEGHQGLHEKPATSLLSRSSRGGGVGLHAPWCNSQVDTGKDGGLPTLREVEGGHARETRAGGAAAGPPGSPRNGKFKEAVNNDNDNDNNNHNTIKSDGAHQSSTASSAAWPINGCAHKSHMQGNHQLVVAAALPLQNEVDGTTYNLAKLTTIAPTTAAPPLHDDKLKVLQLSPHDHNHGKSTFFQATLNCVSLLYGLGILSSPYAVARAGWMGVFISIMVSTTYAYTAYLMARCVEFDPACSNYQDIAKLTLGKRMRKVITAMFYMELTGTLIGYCISMGDNLNYIFPHVGFSLPGLSNRNLMICLVTLIILPSVWLRNLSALSFTSIWCIASSVLLLIGVMLAATVNHIGFTHPLPFIRIKGVPVAAGLYAFSYGGTSVFPSIYKSMKDPTKFTQVLVVSFFIATASIAGLGVAGAYMFGEQTASQVTLSMPVHYITTKIVLWMTILTPIFKFALQLSPITTAVEAQIYKRCSKTQEAGNKAMLFAISTLMRSSVLALIAIISMILPYFEYIIALVGSSMTIGICMIFPCVFYLKLYWKRLPSFTIAFITGLIAVGLIVGACGTLTAFQGLVHSKTGHHS